MMDVNNLLNMINLDIIMVSGGLILGIIICLFGLKFQKLVINISKFWAYDILNSFERFSRFHSVV